MSDGELDYGVVDMDIDQEERQMLNDKLACTSNMVQKRRAQREIMKATPELQFDYNKIVNCSFHRPCNRDGCDHCSGGKPHRRTHKDNHLIYDQRADPKQSRGKSKNFKSRSGAWMVKPFKDLPEHDCHRFTIDLYIEDRQMDGKESTGRERAKFQSFMQQEMPEAVVRMICDISVCNVATEFLFMPHDSVQPRYRCEDRPPEFGFNFHGHLIIWHPFFTRHQISKKLRMFYPGNGRVCYSAPIPETQTSEGYLTGGREGWGEYAGMEKTNVDLPYSDPDNDNYAAIQSMLLIRKNWRRSARKIVYGDKASRVLEIQQLMSVSDDPVVSSDNNPIISENDFCESSLEYNPYITRPTPVHIQ